MQPWTILYTDGSIAKGSTLEEWKAAPSYGVAFIVQGQYIIEGGDLYHPIDGDLIQSNNPFSTAIALGAKAGQNMSRSQYKKLLGEAAKYLCQT